MCDFSALKQDYNKDYKPDPGYYVISDGEQIATYRVVSEFQCKDHCLRHHDCIAYNYQWQFNVPPGQRLCELFSSYKPPTSMKDGFNWGSFTREEKLKVRDL